MGAKGRGTPEHFGMHGEIDIIQGTLSKGLGGIGGFAAGPADLVDTLKHMARGFVFRSAALPPVDLRRTDRGHGCDRERTVLVFTRLP